MMKNSPLVPVLTPLPTQKCYSFVKTCNLIEEYFGADESQWPDPLRMFKQEEKDLGMNSFGMAIAFLIDALVDKQVL